MLQKEWHISRAWTNASGNIEAVEFTIGYTDPQFPGQTSIHGGRMPVSSVSVTATEEELIAAIEAAYGPEQMAGLDQFHYDRLSFQYVLDTSEEVEITPTTPPTVEEIRAAMSPITRRQLRLTLMRNGITLESVSAAIDGMAPGTEREEARIEWEDGITYERLNPTLNMIGGLLGLTQEQIDVMWAEAVVA